MPSDMRGFPTLQGSGFVLDKFPDCAFAYSVRKLRSTYNGPAMILNSSANTNIQVPIGFDMFGDVDRQAVIDLRGGSTGTTNAQLYSWLDQGYFGRHAVQPVAANQPVYLPYQNRVYFDGSASSLSSPSLPSGASAYTIYMGLEHLQFGINSRALLDFSTDNGAADGILIDVEVITSALNFRVYSGNGGLLAATCYANFSAAGSVNIRVDRTQSTSNGQCSLFFDSTLQTPTTNTNETSPRPSANFGSFPFNMAFRPNVSHIYSRTLFRHLVVYPVAHTDAQVAAIVPLLG